MKMSTMNTLLTGVLFFALLLVSGCASDSAQGMVQENSEKTFPSASLNQFVVTLLDSVEKQDEDSYHSFWDINQFAERSLSAVPLNAKGLFSDVNRALFVFFSRNTINMLKDSELTLLEVDPDSSKIKIHLLGSDNLSSYIAFEFSEHQGNYKIVDILDYTMGSYASEKTATILVNLFTDNKQNKAISAQLVNALKSVNANNNVDAVKQLELLPESLLSQKAILTVYLAVSSFDEKQNVKALQLLEKYYEDEPFSGYFLSELYWQRNEREKAVEALKNFAKVVGPAAEIQNQIANLYLTNNDNNNAILYANNALRIDPNYSDAYWTLAQAFAQKEELKDALLALQVLKQHFGYEFNAQYFKEQELFAPLQQFDEFQRWAAQQ